MQRVLLLSLIALEENEHRVVNVPNTPQNLQHYLRLFTRWWSCFVEQCSCWLLTEYEYEHIHWFQTLNEYLTQISVSDGKTVHVFPDMAMVTFSLQTTNAFVYGEQFAYFKYATWKSTHIFLIDTFSASEKKHPSSTLFLLRGTFMRRGISTNR